MTKKRGGHYYNDELEVLSFSTKWSLKLIQRFSAPCFFYLSWLTRALTDIALVLSRKTNIDAWNSQKPIYHRRRCCQSASPYPLSCDKPGQIGSWKSVIDVASHLQGIAHTMPALETNHTWPILRLHCNGKQTYVILESSGHFSAPSSQGKI